MPLIYQFFPNICLCCKSLGSCLLKFRKQYIFSSFKANFEQFFYILWFELQFFSVCSLICKAKNIPEFAGRLIYLLIKLMVMVVQKCSKSMLGCTLNCFVKKQTRNKLGRVFELIQSTAISAAVSLCYEWWYSMLASSDAIKTKSMFSVKVIPKTLMKNGTPNKACNITEIIWCICYW